MTKPTKRLQHDEASPPARDAKRGQRSAQNGDLHKGQPGKADVQPGQPGKADVRAYYERHLPHQVPEGFPIFLTWNLKGALPKRVAAALEQQRRRLEQEPRRPGETDPERQMRHAKLLFARRDHYLDTTRDGPMHLRGPQAAQIVVDSFVWGVTARYTLYAYVVMANHVHVLLMPRVDLEVITQGIKGYTAYQINGLQNERGRVFWHDESFDHWARDDEEMHRIIEYIENNPVRAQLCGRPEDWPWSSAAWRQRLGWTRGAPFLADWTPLVRQAFQPDSGSGNVG